MTREEKVEKIISVWTDAMDGDALTDYFQEGQRAFLEEFTDEQVDTQYREDVLGELVEDE